MCICLVGTAWLNDLWMFDIDTKSWTCIQESSDDENGIIIVGVAATLYHHQQYYN